MLVSGQDLRTGMSGVEVAELHRELARLGTTIPSRERRDRRFGAGTVRAVAAFQQAHGLDQTGVVDRETAAALRALAEGNGEGKVSRRRGRKQALRSATATHRDGEPMRSAPAPREEMDPLVRESAAGITGRVYLGVRHPGGRGHAAGLPARLRGCGGSARRRRDDRPERALPDRLRGRRRPAQPGTAGPATTPVRQQAGRRGAADDHGLRRRARRQAQRRRPHECAAAGHRVRAVARGPRAAPARELARHGAGDRRAAGPDVAAGVDRLGRPAGGARGERGPGHDTDR